MESDRGLKRTKAHSRLPETQPKWDTPCQLLNYLSPKSFWISMYFYLRCFCLGFYLVWVFALLDALFYFQGFQLLSFSLPLSITLLFLSPSFPPFLLSLFLFPLLSSPFSSSLPSSLFWKRKINKNKNRRHTHSKINSVASSHLSSTATAKSHSRAVVAFSTLILRIWRGSHSMLQHLRS